MGEINEAAWRPLVDAARNGDSQAISILYEHSYKTVFYTIRAMVPDEDTALDLTQDTFVKAFSSLDKLSSAEKFTPWIRAIGRNLTLNELAAKKPVLFSEITSEGAEDEDYEPQLEDTDLSGSPEAVVDRKETARLVNEILGSLSDSQRIAVSLYYYEGMSVRQIAAQTGMSESSVKVHLHNGRNRIEEKVKELEKKGTKLYSLAPIAFLLWLLRMLPKNFDTAADPKPEALLGRLQCAGSGISGSAGSGKAGGGDAAGSGNAGLSANARENGRLSRNAENKAEHTAGAYAARRTASATADRAGKAGTAGTAAKVAAAAGTKAAGGTMTAKILAAAAALLVLFGVGSAVTKLIADKAADEPASKHTRISEDDEDEDEEDADESGEDEGTGDASDAVSSEEQTGADAEPVKQTAPVPSQSVEKFTDCIETTAYDSLGNVLLRLTDSGTTAFCYTYDEAGLPVSAVEYGPDGTFNLSYTYEDGLLKHMTRSSADDTGSFSYESDFTYEIGEDGLISKKTERQTWSWGAVVTKTTVYTYNDAGSCIGEVTDYSGEIDIQKEVRTYEVDENGMRTAGTHEVIYYEGDAVTTEIDYTYDETIGESASAVFEPEVILSSWSMDADYTHNYNYYVAGNLVMQSSYHAYKLTLTFLEDGSCIGVGYYTLNGEEQTVTDTVPYTLNGNVISLPDLNLTLIAVYDGSRWVLADPESAMVMTQDTE